MRRLEQAVDKYKSQLRKLKEDCHVSSFPDVVKGSKENVVQDDAVMVHRVNVCVSLLVQR